MSVDSSSDILVMLIEKSPKFFEAISSVKSELDSFETGNGEGESLYPIRK